MVFILHIIAPRFDRLGLGLGFRVMVSVSVRVNSFRESFSVFLCAHHYSTLTARNSNHTLYLTASYG